MKEKIELLSQLPLFEGVEKDKIAEMLRNGATERDFRRDEAIESVSDGENLLCIILSGSALVYSSDCERKVVLRTLGRGNMFGVASLFGGSESEISRVQAKNTCRVLFIRAGSASSQAGSPALRPAVQSGGWLFTSRPSALRRVQMRSH